MQFDPILHLKNGTSKCSKNKNITIPSFENLMKKPQNINPYAYVVGNPVGLTDPAGLYCGSGWNEPYVPDSYGRWDFTEPCKNHDKCYETCGRSKLGCDLYFLGDMISECNKITSFVAEQHSCYFAAAVYYGFVVTLGGDPYKDAQEKSCCKNK